MALPNDTTIEAARVQFSILRQKGISGRAAMTFQLCNNLLKITEAGIRYRHPDYDAKKVRAARLRLTLGDTLSRKVLPHIEIKA